MKYLHASNVQYKLILFNKAHVSLHLKFLRVIVTPWHIMMCCDDIRSPSWPQK